MVSALPPSTARRRLDRVDDLDIAGATAQNAVDRAPDLRARVGEGCGLQRRLARQNHGGGAKAALHRAMLEEGHLQIVGAAVRPMDAFDGRNVMASDVGCPGAARPGQSAVHQDRAQSTGTRFAPALGTGEPQTISQQIQEKQVIREILKADLLTIEREGKVHQGLREDSVGCVAR